MKLNDEKIRMLMHRQRITQSDVSRRCGYSRETVNAICNGRRGCRYEVATAIAEALNTTLEEIKR